MAAALSCAACASENDALSSDPGEARSPLVSSVSVDGDRAARQQEVADWALDRHAQAGRTVTYTQTMPDGTVVDWIDASHLPGGGRAPTPTVPELEYDRAAGVQHNTVQWLSGPDGKVPYIRPSFEPYVSGKSGATDLIDYISRLPSGNPFAGDHNRLYTNVQNVAATNYGAVVSENSNFDTTEVPGAPDFVLTESSVWCEGITSRVGDQVGVIHGRIPALYGSKFVFAVEYFVGGSQIWVNATTGTGAYQQTHPSVGPGSELTGNSIMGGTQLESQMAVWYIDNDPVYPDAWWVSTNGITTGYIPASSFTQLAASACIVSHYVEALDPDHETATPSWMNADMGSGLYPPGSTTASNFGWAGYLRRPGYWASKNGGSFTLVSTAAGSTDERCYSATRTTDGGSSWNPTLWFGGPGVNGSLCTTDPSCTGGIQNGTACCDPRCGTCGGSGCSSFWNDPHFALTGAAACCTGHINASGRSCASNRAPMYAVMVGG